MDRKRLESISTSLIDRTIETCQFSIETIGLDPTEVDKVLLVGGATRMPLVIRRVEEYFQKPAAGKVNPDEVVAQGAAVQAAALTKAQPKVLSGGEKRGLRGPAGGGVVPAPGAGAFGVGPIDIPEPVRGPAATQASKYVAAAPSALGKIPLVKQAAPAPRPEPHPQAKVAEIESALRQFIGEAHGEGAESDEAPVSLDITPSFDFDLDLAPAKTPAAPPALPKQSRGGRAPLPRDDEETTDVQPRMAPPPVAAALPAPDPSPAQPLAPVAPPRAAPLLIDVTPISLGVEVAGGFCDFLIRANTPVPCDRTRVFRTASDNQVAVRVRVVQGESERFSENTYLGDLELSGLRAAARGEVEVAVTFEIDADGILNVRAKEEASGRQTMARMNLLGAQTDSDEVAAMMARQRKHEVV
jgi:molecular chaperone DnaK